MAIEFQIVLQGHDWKNDLHFQHIIRMDSLFERFPEALQSRLEYAREILEKEYKHMLIKHGKHIKVVK